MKVRYTDKLFLILLLNRTIISSFNFLMARLFNYKLHWHWLLWSLCTSTYYEL